ncbi:MAG: catalase family protein [Janthinobacterium lividum]
MPQTYPATPTIPATLLPYSADVETPADDEPETINELIETLGKINETTFKHAGHASRSVHAKSHGIVRGEIEVLGGLPPRLAQGMFAKPGKHPVVMRFSTSPGDMLDDSVSTPRGMALKIIGVEGERVAGSEQHSSQDFLMTNGPAFLKKDAKSFLSSLKLLAATTDHAQALKKVFSAALRVTEKVIESVGGESPTLKSLGGHPETHILGETFYSQVPMRYGDYIGKVSVAPVAPALTALTDAPLNVNGKPNGLREAVVDYFSTQGGEWELRVQLCTDLEAMPIEDATVVWPEDQSPFITVARITVAPQNAWSEARVTMVNDRFSFSPWHALAAHRPLGGIMRSRRAVYEALAGLRAHHNQVTLVEPATLDDLPD